MYICVILLRISEGQWSIDNYFVFSNDLLHAELLISGSYVQTRNDLPYGTDLLQLVTNSTLHPLCSLQKELCSNEEFGNI